MFNCCSSETTDFEHHVFSPVFLAGLSAIVFKNKVNIETKTNNMNIIFLIT